MKLRPITYNILVSLAAFGSAAAVLAGGLDEGQEGVDGADVPLVAVGAGGLLAAGAGIEEGSLGDGGRSRSCDGGHGHGEESDDVGELHFGGLVLVVCWGIWKFCFFRS